MMRRRQRKNYTTPKPPSLEQLTFSRDRARKSKKERMMPRKAGNSNNSIMFPPLMNWCRSSPGKTGELEVKTRRGV